MILKNEANPTQNLCTLSPSFYRTRVRSLATLVTHSLTNSCLVILMPINVFNDANCMMMLQQLLKAVKRLSIISTKVKIQNIDQT